MWTLWLQNRICGWPSQRCAIPEPPSSLAEAMHRNMQDEHYPRLMVCHVPFGVSD